MATAENKSSTSDQTPEVPTLQIIRGLPFTTWFKKETVEEIFEFEPQDGDILIATYPKTGTTWMQYIVHQIMSRGAPLPSFKEMLDKIIPFLEMAGVAAVEAMTARPRLYKHHFPYNLVKKNPKTKVIYVYRRPEDTFVSYFHFMRNLDLACEFDQYFEDFLTGNISYGSYFPHVRSYLERTVDGNILMVSYEKMQRNRKEEILRVAKFLGEEYYNDLVNDESIIDRIIEHTSFDYMKSNLSVSNLKDRNEGDKESFEGDKESKDQHEPKEKPVNFFRKGIIGDGKNSLTSDQLFRLQETVKEAMKGTDILAEWLQE